MYIVDRRLNPGGKSLGNRQRFLRRAQALVRRAVRDSSKERGIRDMGEGGEVSIPADGVREPSAAPLQSRAAVREHVLPGNKDFLEGDTIPRPAAGEGAAAPKAPTTAAARTISASCSRRTSSSTSSSTTSSFPISPSAAVEGIENLDLAARGLLGRRLARQPRRCTRTMRNSLSRRIALKRPKSDEMEEIEAEIALLEEIGRRSRPAGAAADAARRRSTSAAARIPLVDPIDLRYRQYQPYPRPVAQAVMFCLMDVSGSMTEHDEGPRQALLRAALHLPEAPLPACGDRLHPPHPYGARRWTRTRSSTPPRPAARSCPPRWRRWPGSSTERFRPEDWNIYAAQASDGDNAPNDNDKTAVLLKETLLPVCQYFAYLEVGPEDEPSLDRPRLARQRPVAHL